MRRRIGLLGASFAGLAVALIWDGFRTSNPAPILTGVGLMAVAYLLIAFADRWWPFRRR